MAVRLRQAHSIKAGSLSKGRKEMLMIDTLTPLAEIDDLDSQQAHDCFVEYHDAMAAVFKIEVDGRLAGIMHDKEQWKKMSRSNRFDQIHKYHRTEYERCAVVKNKRLEA
jgi:hypothetical protein|tara:strand:- start:219 stop:548 length:330 start_codon:yes stop_codon:yes gene_type:complete